MEVLRVYSSSIQGGGVLFYYNRFLYELSATRNIWRKKEAGNLTRSDLDSGRVSKNTMREKVFFSISVLLSGIVLTSKFNFITEGQSVFTYSEPEQKQRNSLLYTRFPVILKLNRMWITASLQSYQKGLHDCCICCNQPKIRVVRHF